MDVLNQSALNRLAHGEMVALPPFSDSVPFMARLKRPSLMGLAVAGLIPNPLMAVCEKLWQGKIFESQQEDNSFVQMAEVFKIVAREALVAPTLEAITQSGIMLTDMQLLAIFNYTQTGVCKFAPFRGRQDGSAPAGCGAEGA